jgi:predicted ATPase with chaperone activity
MPAGQAPPPIPADTGEHERQPNWFNLENPRILDLAPGEPRKTTETGLRQGLLNDLALKYLYYQGVAQGVEIAGELKLPWTGVMEDVVNFLVQEKLVDLRGGKGFGRASVDFILTEKGRDIAKEAIGRSSYIGPAPVPVEQYNALVTAVQQEAPLVGAEQLKLAFSHLVIDSAMLDRLGPAVNSSRALFLYGPPGNGKTTIAETLASTLPGEVFVPYALEIDSQIVKVFDPIAHPEVALESDDPNAPKLALDQRWVMCRRPSVTVGGELTLETLDLIWDESARFYEAPFQVKANGGMLLIDDFGRQRVHPTDLLNRWIVPLEKRIDYMTLHTGKKFEIPFDQLVVFSTNLDPKELVDEAFLRRIKYKIEVGNPTEPQYRQIFRAVCEKHGVPYHEGAMNYIIDRLYRQRGTELRGCHPRDLVQLIVDAARYRQTSPALTKELIDQAALSFFVEI